MSCLEKKERKKERNGMVYFVARQVISFVIEYVWCKVQKQWKQ